MKRINSLKIWIIAEIVAIAVIGILIIIKTAFAGNVTEDAGYTLPSDSSKEVSFNDIELPEDLTAEGNEDGVPEKDADKYKLDEYPEEVKARLAEMNTEQKLSMLFITTPEALCETDGIISADEGFRRAYDSYPVSGLIFSDSN
ncbi:MAG: hypothetical protein J5966_05190, partial [Lachnospiraceae bacterium]|nr:hypothetical protein [Lachnospiraceae bacterium]